MSDPAGGRPPPITSLLAVLLAAGAVAAVVDAPTQRIALAGTVGGALLVLLGARVQDGGVGAQIGGDALAVVGLAVAGVAVVHGVTAVAGYGRALVLLPGLVGIVLVSLGVFPLHDRYAGGIVSAGAGALLVGVVLAGTFGRATAGEMLGAGVLAVVSWDVGTHGIGVGRHLGTDARTWPVELVHPGATACYGAAVAIVGAFVYGYGGVDLPLAALVFLLVAAITLTVALYD